MTEGPKEFVIPERRVLTCGDCIYYSHKLFKSGIMPRYNDSCKHKEAPETYDPTGNIELDFPTDLPLPGEWCPFIDKNKK